MGPAQRDSPATRTLYSWRESQTAYRMGYAATSAMSNIDGETIQNASCFSERPRERRLRDAPVETVASAMVLEGLKRLLDVGLGLLHGVRRGLLTRERRVDVLVDRLRDLRVHRG